jgi:cytochrome P450
MSSSHKEPPGPWGLPIVGYLPFLGMKMNVTLTDLSKKYGDVYQLRMGTRKVVVVNGQRAVREGLLKRQTDLAGRPDFFTYTAAPSFGFNTYNQSQRIQKKFILKAFGTFANKRRVELHQVAHNATDMLINVIKESNGEPFDPEPILYKAACTVMGYICYGKMFNADSPEVDEILKRGKDFSKAIAFGIICDYIPFSKILIKKKLENFKQLMLNINKFSYALSSENVETYDGENMRDIGDMFRKESEQMSESERNHCKVDKQDLKELLSGIFGAGFATVASSLKVSLMLMALNKEVQMKVQEEIDRVIGRNHLPDADDISDMPYTSAVISENYRFHSMSALAVTHCAMCDTELDGYFISKDTPVVFNLFSAHRDETVFKDPYKYNPDRFLTPDGQLDTAAVENVIPYGLGLRRCAGEIIARLEVAVFFVSMMQRCIIEESPDHPLDFENYIMTFGISHRPFKLVFKPRYSGAY